MAQVPQVPGDVNQEELINQLNNTVRELNNRDTVQVYKDEAGTRRVILDKDGLRTSPGGVDVYNATDDELTFNSNNNVFKIVQSGTVSSPEVSTISAAAGKWSTSLEATSVNHNLGYVPIVHAFLDVDGSYYSLPYTLTLGSATDSTAWYTMTITVVANSTDISFQVFSNVYGTTFSFDSYPIKYYILQETAN